MLMKRDVEEQNCLDSALGEPASAEARGLMLILLVAQGDKHQTGMQNLAG